jgi:hypothetical protein
MTGKNVLADQFRQQTGTGCTPRRCQDVAIGLMAWGKRTP